MRVLILFVVAALAQKPPPLEKPDKELFNAAIEAMKKLDIEPKEVMMEDKHLDTLKEELPEDQYNAVVLMISMRHLWSCWCFGQGYLGGRHVWW